MGAKPRERAAKAASLGQSTRRPETLALTRPVKNVERVEREEREVGEISVPDDPTARKKTNKTKRRDGDRRGERHDVRCGGWRIEIEVL